MAMDTRSPSDSKEWGVKARMIGRDTTTTATASRRFSSSHISSFREDGCKSFRSHFTVSSTASSPGYSLKEEIDPSTYSFTNAIKALQLRSINTWECGFTLNSKWNEAERYICNPLSGEVPVECLSSKTLHGTSFRNIKNRNRITLSAPSIHNLSSRPFHPVPTLKQPHKLTNIHPIQDKNEEKENTLEMKNDVEIQSTPSERSRSPSPANSTPPIQERPIKCNLDLDSSEPNFKSESELKTVEVEGKEEESHKDNEEDSDEDEGNKSKTNGCMCKHAGGCLFFKDFWTKRPHKNLSCNHHSNKGCLINLKRKN